MPPPVLVVRPDHADGIYALDEKVTWTVEVKSGDRAALKAVPYVVKKDAQDVLAEGTLDLSASSATVTVSRPEPGALLAFFNSPDPSQDPKKPLALGGALVAPFQIAPAAPAPADFDAFWKEKLEAVAAVPPNPVLEKGTLDGVPNSEGIDYYKVTLDNVEGTHVRGQLARPTSGDKFPAILVVQWAGVYPLQKAWVTGLAKEGFLVLNIEAHDIPIDEPQAFYDDLKNNALKNYTSIGAESRETAYFLRMFQRDIQAATYLTSRPDWDGKTLIVTGTSQGGLQSFATAALFPKVTHMMVLVPAGCDVLGPYAQPPRAASWPNWYWFAGDKEKIKATSAYFDPVYFASRIPCPALVAPGLLDETARPGGILAAFNALPNPGKELVPMPFSPHQNIDNSQTPYGVRASAWRAAIKAGKPIPPPAPAP